MPDRFFPFAFTAAEVEIVSVDTAVTPDDATLTGEKTHVVPAGNPEQVNEIAPANPFCGITEMMFVTDCPDTTLSDGRKTLKEKSATGKLIA